MLESKVVKHLQTCVKLLGGECEQLTTGRVGPPDKLVTLPWLGMELIELKRPKGGRLEKWQKRDHQRRRKLGVRVETLYTIEQVDEWYERRKFVLLGLAGAHPEQLPPHLYEAHKIMADARRRDVYGDYV